MLLAEAVGKFRAATRDTVQPYLWEDCEIHALLFEGQKQASIRKRLLREDSDPKVSRLILPAGTRRCNIHSSVYSIDYADLVVNNSLVKRLIITDRDSMYATDPEWRMQSGEPEFLIHDDTVVTVSPAPVVESVLHLDVTRFPYGPDTAEFEVSEEHHEAVVWYALGQAYLDADSDSFDLQRSRLFMDRFDSMYGPQVQAGARRRARAGAPHRNRVQL